MFGEGSSAPTISSASCWAVTSDGRTAATVVPRRTTVMSSATASTSSSLCEMKISVWPWPLELAEVREQRVDLLRHQHRGGLVEDDHLGTAVEHLEDLDPLPLPHAELLDQLVGIQAEAVGAGDPLHLGPGPVADAVQPLGAQHHVLEHGQVVGEHEVLEHHADAQPDRVGGRAHRGRRPVDLDRPRVGSLDAVQDLHQGGLAGAVLTDDGVHRAGADVDVDVVVGDHAGEPLADATQADRGLVVHSAGDGTRSVWTGSDGRDRRVTRHGPGRNATASGPSPCALSASRSELVSGP